MEALDYWRFCDELTVVQAALLIVGEDPAGVSDDIDQWGPVNRPKGYIAVLTALQHSILSDRLRANIEYSGLFADSRTINSVNWHFTRISVHDLKRWLGERGVKSGFFFPDGPATAEYLEKQNECFAPKLAAAVTAWTSVRAERAASQSPRSVKQDLTRWLNLHAADFDLTNDEGEPNKQAVEEVAKVANWDRKGGAPRTPQAGSEGSHDPDHEF